MTNMIAMDSFAVGAELLLAAVFAVAGVAKLLDLRGSQTAVAEFGVPQVLAPLLGFLLPIAELVAAVLLVLRPTSRIGAAIALALLLAFIAGISNAMFRGKAPDCNCFGQLHSAPAGGRTLARNSILAAIALVLLINGPGPAIDTWVSDRTAAELVAIVAVSAAIGLGSTALWLWSQNRKLDAHLEIAHARAAAGPSVEVDWDVEGLPAGTTAPAFALADAHGGIQTLEDLLAAGKPLMLFFMEPGCGPCKGLMPSLANWQEAVGDRVSFAILSTSSPQSAPVWQEHAIANVLYDESRDVFRAYHLQGTPKAILVDPRGTIAGGPAGGMHMPEVLLRVALRRQESDDWSPRTVPNEPQLAVIQPQTA